MVSLPLLLRRSQMNLKTKILRMTLKKKNRQILSLAMVVPMERLHPPVEILLLLNSLR